MRALLLAAGLGTRLKPLTDTLPKCLMPIHGRPLLEFWLESMASAGIAPSLVNLHAHADMVREYLDHCGYENIHSVYEEELLGTGGTLLKNKKFFEGDSILLVHADNLSYFNAEAFVQAHASRPPECEITMMLFRTPEPEKCGIVELDERGVVQKFHEKVERPPGDLANGAVYIIEASLFPYLESLGREFIDFSVDVIPEYLGKIYTFFNEDFHRDIGNPNALRSALADYNFPVPEGRADAEWNRSFAEKRDAIEKILNESE